MKFILFICVYTFLLFGHVTAWSIVGDGIFHHKNPMHTQHTMVQKPTKSESIFYEGFESLTTNGQLPEGWEIKRSSALDQLPVSDANWPHWFRNSNAFDGFSNPSIYIHEGEGSMGIAWDAPDFTWAISPVFDIPDSQNDIYLNYWVWILNDYYEDQMHYSNYFVKIFADDQWHLLIEYIGNNQNTNLFETIVVQNLNEFRGKEVRLAFISEFTDGWQMAVDEIRVSELKDIDFGVKNLVVFPTFGVLPGEETDITFQVYTQSNDAGSVNASLLINGIEKEIKSSGQLSHFGMEEKMRFTWEPEYFGHHTIEIRLPYDQNPENNSVSKHLYVYHYHNLAEDFENFDLDGLGFPVFQFPPDDWTISSPEWIIPTFQFQVSGEAAAWMISREEIPEQALITKKIDFDDGDNWIRFMVRGVNNNIHVDPDQYPGAIPPGVQGYSTLQLKYASNVNGPWHDLGEPIAFKNIYDDDQNLIQSANGIRAIERDVSHISGDHYIGFFHTSSFALLINGIPFYSYITIDDVMVGNDPGEAIFHVRNPDETGLAGAVVQIYDAENNQVRNVLTSSQGVASLPLLPGHYAYKIMKLGYKTEEGTFYLNHNQLEMDIILQIPASDYAAVIEVLKPGGLPGTNTEIAISSFWGITDGEGKIIVSGLAPGSYDLRAYLSGFDTYFGHLVIENTDITHTIHLNPGETNIPELNLPVNISIFPNPARDLVSIVSESIIFRVEVFDLSGRQIGSRSVNYYTCRLDLSYYSPGLYVLRVHTSDGAGVHKIQILK